LARDSVTLYAVVTLTVTVTPIGGVGVLAGG
jgi:hypothetical protein